MISIGEYLFNVLCVVFIIDLIYCTHLIKKDRFVVKQFGLDSVSKWKLCIEKLILVSYIIYLVIKLILVCI